MASTPDGHIKIVSAVFDLSIELRAFLHKLELRFLNLLMSGFQPLHPHTW